MVEDIEDIVLSYKPLSSVQSQTSSSSEKAPIFLKDVAKVSYVNKDPQNIVRINGQRCVGLSIYKETGFNTVKAVEDLTESLESIKKALPGY